MQRTSENKTKETLRSTLKTPQAVQEAFGWPESGYTTYILRAFELLFEDEMLIECSSWKEGLCKALDDDLSKDHSLAQRYLDRAIEQNWYSQGLKAWKALFNEIRTPVPPAKDFIVRIYRILKENGWRTEK